MKRLSSVEDFLNNRSFRKWVVEENKTPNSVWQDYMVQHPDIAHEMELAIGILEESAFHGDDWDKRKEDLLFARISGTIRTKSVKSKANWGFSRASVIVASLLLVLFGITQIETLKTFIKPDTPFLDRQSELIIRKNPDGQKTKVYLPDGSIVYMNSGSRLTYDKAFNITNRNLCLEGEGYFQVEKNQQIPFIVTSGSLITKAVGTAFNIRAYEEEEKVSVQLLEGVVEVSSREDTVMLAVNEGVVKSDHGKIEKGNFNLEKVSAWRKGVILFEYSDWDKIKRELERWYGVAIHAENEPVRPLEFSGKYKNASLKDVLESLSFSMNFTYEINQKEIKIVFI